MKRIFSSAAVLVMGMTLSLAQAPEQTVRWKAEASQIEGDLYEIVLTGKIEEGWHTYDLKSKYSATEIEFDSPDGYTLEGEPYELSESVELDGDNVFFGEIKLGQKIRLSSKQATVKGMVSWISCSDTYCTPPNDYEFSIEVKNKANKNVTAQNKKVSRAERKQLEADSHSTIISDPTEDDEASKSLWGLIIEAILWGFAMLLTPCVFPMVPMTISFFLKGSTTPAAGRFKAFMYGLFIILLYTVPISVIILLTWILGGDAVTADIFNWLATHWLPNIIFFIVFMVFAASFFGAFEITLPSSLVNKSDQKSDKGGLAGIFFMALTLVLVSFSCTGPIVGSVLIKSTQGEFWTPMLTMLAFSIAFALPFTLFAMFPSILKKMKSGSWLNSVKVVLGFIEVALGFKFLSTADQTYHWGLLDREIYLAIWIVVF